MIRTYLLAACATSTSLLGPCSPALAQVGTVDPGVAQAQPGADENIATVGADIVVTGTLIRGTREDAALPVDVIGAEELARQGSPSVTELIKNLPVSNGVIGDANQFDARAQGAEGIASVNLRGLGPQRTLVLLNGKRIVQVGNTIPVVDVNMIPVGAIGRIEVLKDGAAATYGSDAIAGVVNFITRTDQQGFLASGEYRYIDGSDGNYSANVSYGHHQDGFGVLASFGYTHRSELQTIDRDFTVQPYPNSPQGGYTGGGNPGNFDFNATVGGINFVRDLGCESLGGFRSLPGSTTDRCFNNYGQFGNLVEPEDRYQAYLETNLDLADGLTFSGSALYSSTSTRLTTSPSYLPTQPPSANAASGGAGLFIVPTYAPALRDYCAVYGADAGCLTAPGGQPLAPALAFPVLFRSVLLGGNPLFLNADSSSRGSAYSQRKSDLMRFSAALSYEVSSRINLDSSFSFSEYDRKYYDTDSFGDLFQNAIAGFGGPDCAFATPQSRAGMTADQIAALAGTNGCTFYNPFSTAVQMNPVTGQTNPNFAGSRNTNGLSTVPGAGLVNDLPTFDLFFRQKRTQIETQLLVGDVTLSGHIPVRLPGGEVGFAVGGQFRKNYYKIAYNNDGNLAVNPCPGSPLNPSATCNPQTGALGFLGTASDRRLSNDIYAVFGELQLPITDNINAQVSARYEDYGGAVGSTFNPQGRLRFQVTNWLALRGGAGTTFRGPPPSALNGNITSLQIIGSSFRAVDLNGNPNLAPEKATTYSGGVILDFGDFTASADYYRYDFRGPQEYEPVQGIVNALFGATGAANCANPAYAGLFNRFTFSGGNCGIGNVQRLRTMIINSADVSTQGIDVQAQYRRNFTDGFVGVGFNGTYVIDYKTNDQTVEGIVVQPSFDAVGKLNYQTTAYPLPEIKGVAFLEGAYGIHSARLQYNYIDGYTDQRGAAIFGPNAGALAGAAVTAGKQIGSFDTLDLTYRLALPTGTTIALSALNILDKDPSFARLDQNYDPFTASPLGFTAKVGVSQKF